ncbi:SCO family protein [Hydrogenobacter hydrogenophilus]|uniref:Protein SCO1/2 n=1 Tax=Hydrogenobacter hydrogenophilus TaxID=35835 RepID=A0A285NWL4_9AQUI|nr:SCO family protein [Hydrogenobacter hydrogenophilus]SNZ13882.1 protein SCO1/2 [Hydrogenobacter hydrogenophilus]
MRSLVRLLFWGILPLLLFFSYTYSQGTGIPPNESRTLGKHLPHIELMDSYGNTFDIYELKGKPIILSPIYTHCSSACPIITDSLKKAISQLGKPGKDFWVISFSFDPKDTVKDIRKFQEEHHIDGIGWKVVIAKDKENLFRLVDAIDFRFMTLENRDFIHPNLLVVISPDMRVKKYLYGVVFSHQDLKKAMGKESILEIARPYVFFVGLLGFVSTSLYILLKIFKR